MAHIVFLSLLFSPDGVSTAQLVTELAVGLKEKGHKIDVLAGTPHYNVDHEARSKHKLSRRLGGLYYESEINGVRVIHVPIAPKGKRVYSRIIDYFLYHLYSLFYYAIFVKKPDVIFSTTPPPTIGINAVLLSKLKRAPHIYNIREIFPDVLMDMGLLKNDNIISILSEIEKRVYKETDAIVVLSENFRDELLRKGAPRDKVFVIPDFVDTEFITPGERKNDFSRRYGLDDKFVVQYAGNIGLTQGFEIIVEAAKRLTEYDDIHFLIVGGGTRYEWLKGKIAHHKLDNMTLLPYQPRNLVPDIYASSDICLIVLKGDTAITTIPSKIYSIMGAARPVLASVSVESELAKLVEKAKCGWIVKPDDSESLIGGIISAYKKRGEIKDMGMRGRDFVVNNFSKESVIEKYDALIKGLIGK